MGPALAAKCGSRANTQLRWVQGLMASSCNHRQIVVPAMSATIPRLMASRRISARLKRDSGRPLSWGISHARALTATTTSGGKFPRAARPGFVAEAGQTAFEKPLSPLADDLTGGVEALADRLVGQAIGGVEDDPGAQNVYIR